MNASYRSRRVTGKRTGSQTAIWLFAGIVAAALIVVGLQQSTAGTKAGTDLSGQAISFLNQSDTLVIGSFIQSRDQVVGPPDIAKALRPLSHRNDEIGLLIYDDKALQQESGRNREIGLVSNDTGWRIKFDTDSRTVYIQTRNGDSFITSQISDAQGQAISLMATTLKTLPNFVPADWTSIWGASQ
jgi:hypothetical protein